MKKHIKVRNNLSGEIIEIIVKDFSGRTIDRYKFNGRNGLFYGNALENIYNKFGMRPIIRDKQCVVLKEYPESNFFNY